MKDNVTAMTLFVKFCKNYTKQIEFIRYKKRTNKNFYDDKENFIMLIEMKQYNTNGKKYNKNENLCEANRRNILISIDPHIVIVLNYI